MELLSGSCPVFDGGVRKTFRLYKAGSAEKHAASDDETLRKALQQALNAPASRKEDQGDGVFRFKINNNNGYLVYKVGVRGPSSAAIFHYHWNYTLDIDLRVPRG